MDIERRLEAALAAEAEASAIYTWLPAVHRAAFVEFVRGEAFAGGDGGVEERIDEVVSILSGRSSLAS